MLHTGLVSVTFRQLLPAEIIALVRQVGLEGIEWGGDVHVPPGDLAQATRVCRQTQEAGLQVASYGSYYVVGGADETAFERVLETALALNAPTVRVWAGERGSGEAGAGGWDAVAADARRIAGLAASAGVRLAFEYHENTLTDTSEAALRLLRQVNHANMGCYWQPPVGLSLDERRQGLEALAPWLSNLHVYQLDGEEKRPLSDGKAEWQPYIAWVRRQPGEHYALLEFVQDDAPSQFLEDAAVLKTLCG